MATFSCVRLVYAFKLFSRSCLYLPLRLFLVYLGRLSDSRVFFALRYALYIKMGGAGTSLTKKALCADVTENFSVTAIGDNNFTYKLSNQL